MLLDFGDGADLPGGADDRVFRRQIAVGDRIIGGPLEVRIVIGAAHGGADQFDAEGTAEFEEFDRFREIVAEAGAVAAEGVLVVADADAVAFHRDADFVGPFFEGETVEDGKARADFEAGDFAVDAFDDFAEEAGAVLETAAEFAGALEGGEEFMAEIAVRHLDVDKVEPGFFGKLCRSDEVADDVAQLVVGDDVGRRAVKPFVEQRVTVGGDRFELRVVVRMAVAAGVGELEPDIEVVGGAELHRVAHPHFGRERLEFRHGGGGNHELAGVAFAGLHHRAGLAAEEEFRAAFGEVEPAAAGQFGGGAVGQTVPPLHGEDAPAVADFPAVILDGLRERAGRSGEDGVVDLKLQSEFLQVFPERLGGLERCDFRVIAFHGQNLFSFLICKIKSSQSVSAS